MYIADQTWPGLGDYVAESSLAVVPLGSTGRHGPHPPFATDHLIAKALTREAADRTGCLCTPTVNVGVSPHHRQFHGTMWVDPPQFRDYMEPLTHNLVYHGIDRVVSVNAHGGNVQHLREVGRRPRDDDTMYAIKRMWDESIPDLVTDLFDHPGPHGGSKETSMIIHVARDLIREGELDSTRDGGVVDLGDDHLREHGARTFYDAIENSGNDIFGDQTDASPETGEELFETVADQLVRLLSWLDDQPIDDLLAPMHVDPQPGSRC